MPVFDFTDYTCGYKMADAANQVALDEAGLMNLPDSNSCGTLTGSGNFNPDKGRGPMVHNNAHLSKDFAGGAAAYDIRGTNVSITIATWIKQTTNFTGQPFGFSIHGTTAVKQACQLSTGLVGPEFSPQMSVADGLSAFNYKTVRPNISVKVVLGDWNFLVGGYNHVTNKVFGFWGKSAGVSYYGTTDGFAAGFGYTGVGSLTKFGFWSNSGQTGRIEVDNSLWWKDRALTEAECVILWNNHDGLDFGALDGNTEPAEMVTASHINRRRRKRDN